MLQNNLENLENEKIEDISKNNFKIEQEINNLSKNIWFLAWIITCITIFYFVYLIYFPKEDLNIYYLITAFFLLLSFSLVFFCWRLSMKLKILKEQK